MQIVVGRMHTGGVTHLGRLSKTHTDPDGHVCRLYQPLCARLNSRSVAYLGRVGGEAQVTCQKCQAKMKKHYELVALEDVQ